VGEFRKNTGQTTSEGESCGVVTRRQLKEVITLQRAMTKKGRQFLEEKYVTQSVAAHATPTLVTPLCSPKILRY